VYKQVQDNDNTASLYIPLRPKSKTLV